MFKNLMQFWKGKDFLQQVLEDFKNMLEDTHNMFDSICKKLVHNEEVKGLDEEIYKIDKNVNRLERDIRKRIVQHLSLQPSVDVSMCLLLMSVVKDAERLGDYSKNLFEITRLLDKPIDNEKYTPLFNSMEKDISELFNQAEKAFIEADEETAASSWKHERDIVKRCDKIVNELPKSSLSVNEAVCFVLMARYYKRIAAHLANIATSVILPLSDLDYFDEKRRIE